MPELTVYDAEGYDLDGMRAPEGKGTYFPREDQSIADERVRDFFFDGVTLVDDQRADSTWTLVRAARDPTRCVEQYYAVLRNSDEETVAGRVERIRERIAADDRLVLDSRDRQTHLSTYVKADPGALWASERVDLQGSTVERRLRSRPTRGDRVLRLGAPTPEAAFAALDGLVLEHAERAAIAVASDFADPEQFDVVVEPNHERWTVLGPEE